MTESHVSVNRDFWNGMAHDWVAMGERQWARDSPSWGIWTYEEAELNMLPKDMTGMDAIELGCGTGYVSCWMAKRGAKVTGIDISSEQLATAKRLAAAENADITFALGNAEAVDAPDASFDFAISEYGAAIWCDPDIWLREAWRVLRPGGRLVFLGSHPFTIICTDADGAPCEPTLHRSYKTLTKADWTEVAFEPGGIEFNRSFSAWLALFQDIGFTLDEYLELYAKPGSKQVLPTVPVDWALDYPSEQVWKLTKPLSAA